MFKMIYFSGRGKGLKGRVGRGRKRKYKTSRELIKSVHSFNVFYPDNLSYISSVMLRI